MQCCYVLDMDYSSKTYKCWNTIKDIEKVENIAYLTVADIQVRYFGLYEYKLNKCVEYFSDKLPA